MSKRDIKKELEIIEMALNGETMKKIGDSIGITKQRVNQVLNKYNIKTIDIRREKRKKELMSLVSESKKMIKNGTSVKKIRTKLNIDTAIAKELLEYGVNLMLVDKVGIQKRREACLNHYKKGLTAYEIMDIVPGLRNVNSVYIGVSALNNGHLPKRINTRAKMGFKLTSKIVKLKKQHTFEEVTNILNDRGITNLNNGKLKVGTVIQRYYNAKKQNLHRIKITS